MPSNVNTLDYWDNRFGSGDWEAKGGYSQTRAFAQSQILYLNLPSDISGIVCDFGCGAGDAFPVYRAAYPNATLVGVDFSAQAIRLCRDKYGAIAEFIDGGYDAVPAAEAIIISNVLEHLDDDKLIVQKLLTRCKRLFVVVPYREHELCSEHIRTYDDDTFREFSVTRKVIFASHGWSEFGWKNLAKIRLENIARYLSGKPSRTRRMQILYEMAGDLARPVQA